ncbi:extensin-like isoform X1 [Zerene cesonia]|uniref:extensin-like isoform X1 n=2 Tax=Zerene cesonia TaxID=33412 RepID=UPI0018E56DAC|nr:extensin-like isoform X1 [Zerene cesonia]
MHQHDRHTGMSLDEGRQSQRPYRYGMVLLCAGALINWLGLAEDYAEPVRYVGVACIVAGALLICAAMCCWLQSPARQPQNDRATPDTHQIDDPIHVISMPDEETMQQKPPDYDTVAGAPPTYDDAIKLNPARLLPATSSTRADPPLTQHIDALAIPGQLEDAFPGTQGSALHPPPVPVHLPPAPVHLPPTPVPKTPPPPYRAPHAIR